MSMATKGQSNRKQIRETIESHLSDYCPDVLDRLADRIAYDYNLSPYTVRYTYLPMFITVGRLKYSGNGMYSTDKSSVSNPREEAEEINKIRRKKAENGKG